MKLLALVIALMAFQVQAENRLDTFGEMDISDQCQVKSNLYLQGIRAYYLDRKIKDHIKLKHSGTLDAEELAFALKWMAPGERMALREWGLDSRAITKAWAVEAAMAFNRKCVKETDKHTTRI